MLTPSKLKECLHSVAFPGEKYPLEQGEQNALITNMLASECLLLIVGVVGSMVVSGITTGDWLGAIFGFGWARGIAQSCMALSAVDTAIAAVATAALMVALAYAVEFVASRTESGRQNILFKRQGFNGEIPRIDSYAVFAAMFAAGFAEELVFRFALLLGARAILVLFVPMEAATVVAVVVSVVAFWLSHEEYRDAYTISMIVLDALVLCLSFVITGSYLVVAIAHALYDIADLEIEGWRMVRDDDYFGGEPPQSAMLDMYEDVWREENERANRGK